MILIMARRYGSPVCCKPYVTDLEISGLTHLYSVPFRGGVAPGKNGYAHASHRIRGRILEDRMCRQITDATVGPFSIIQLADLGRNDEAAGATPGFSA
jgi:hypothetical protein